MAAWAIVFTVLKGICSLRAISIWVSPLKNIKSRISRWAASNPTVACGTVACEGVETDGIQAAALASFGWFLAEPAYSRDLILSTAALRARRIIQGKRRSPESLNCAVLFQIFRQTC